MYRTGQMTIKIKIATKKLQNYLIYLKDIMAHLGLIDLEKVPQINVHIIPSIVKIFFSSSNIRRLRFKKV